MGLDANVFLVTLQHKQSSRHARQMSSAWAAISRKSGLDQQGRVRVLDRPLALCGATPALAVESMERLLSLIFDTPITVKVTNQARVDQAVAVIAGYRRLPGRPLVTLDS